ncbi:MAG: hypothetical protein HRU09_17865 [Oligoflexales bacterium]|nr:hypothetical protein [Oligoflexales bacterium]
MNLSSDHNAESRCKHHLCKECMRDLVKRHAETCPSCRQKN